ncbi:hypothetical protein RRG08_047597 [Elysia crispata]|uniref:Uncharacterized protein n=1 Tax=Elysia crispata TaxID=231223 RepID=A0AAE1CJP5_9GAST|nr:hypothetical protein RRG08_047597 [Elysia crispata]
MVFQGVRRLRLLRSLCVPKHFPDNPGFISTSFVIMRHVSASFSLKKPFTRFIFSRPRRLCCCALSALATLLLIQQSDMLASTSLFRVQFSISVGRLTCGLKIRLTLPVKLKLAFNAFSITE